VLAAWLDTDPTATGMDNTLIIGDLNSYDHESPIDALVSAGYSDVVRDGIGESAYSYVFSGQWGYLDYVMADESIGKFITGATIWHINADEADLLDYDNSFKSDAQIAAWTSGPYRSPDHDPVIVGLDFTAPQADKLVAVAELSAVLAGADKRTVRRLESAIESVMDSLAAEWWIDDHTIGSKKVFDHERIAISQLLQIAKRGGDAALAASSAIDLLIEADRELALFAIAGAVQGGGDAGLIAEAIESVYAAEAFLEAGELTDAVNAFKSAWAKASRS